MNDPKELSDTKARPMPLSPNKQQTAEYIAAMVIELSEMAEEAGLPLLQSMIETVAEEAMREVGKPRHRTH